MAVSTLALQYSRPVEKPKGGESNLGKDDFLKLMMMQMRHQDPLNPMDNQAMLSQMAQFSSLEQMSNLNTTLTHGNNMNEFMNATRLLGKEVAVLDPSSTRDEPRFYQAMVESVSYGKEGAILTLDNGLATTVEQIVKVNEPRAEK